MCVSVTSVTAGEGRTTERSNDTEHNTHRSRDCHQPTFPFRSPTPATQIYDRLVTRYGQRAEGTQQFCPFCVLSPSPGWALGVRNVRTALWRGTMAACRFLAFALRFQVQRASPQRKKKLQPIAKTDAHHRSYSTPDFSGETGSSKEVDAAEGNDTTHGVRSSNSSSNSSSRSVALRYHPVLVSS